MIEIFNFNKIVDGHHNFKYRGVTTKKCPFDYALYQMIINEVKPDLVIEIGTNHGGSSLYIADLLEIIGNGVVHTIDIVNLVDSDLIENHNRIFRFLGGYKSYDLNLTKNYEKIIVIDDGSHMYGDVLNVLNLFKDVVSEGSYFIIEDGSLNYLGWESKYDGGPLKAIDEFVSENKNFEIDRGWCDFFGENATFNPNGYIKKLK